ncbi:hypothetical protein [Caenispirillum salinarum]|nr:hypothetical protein [Caenispirillum salinarum]
MNTNCWAPPASTAPARAGRPQRLLSLREAAFYVGCRSEQTFRDEVALGLWPPPLPLTRLSGKRKRLLWDILALDARISELSGAAQTGAVLHPDHDLDAEFDFGNP